MRAWNFLHDPFFRPSRNADFYVCVRAACDPVAHFHGQIRAYLHKHTSKASMYGDPIGSAQWKRRKYPARNSKALNVSWLMLNQVLAKRIALRRGIVISDSNTPDDLSIQVCNRFHLESIARSGIEAPPIRLSARFVARAGDAVHRVGQKTPDVPPSVLYLLRSCPTLWLIWIILKFCYVE